MKKTYFLMSEKIGLRGLTPDDAAVPYLDWLNDAEVCAGNDHHRWPFGPAAATAFISEAASDRQNLVLAVEILKTGQHIGNIALQSIDPIHRSAEIAFLIGSRTAWGKGYAREAGRLLLRHGFQELNLQRIGCGTPDYNAGMIKLALALGMKEEGRRRCAFFKGGKYHDVVIFGILSNELEK
jgi:RimJ/RimL family protein N-acetyltransferase